MKKNVMKRAWEIYRTLQGDHTAKLSMALTEAWAEAKGTNKADFNGYATINFDCWTIDGNLATTFKAWNKNGKSRIYINDYKGRGLGYIDLNNGNNIVITTDNSLVESRTIKAAEMFMAQYKIA